MQTWYYFLRRVKRFLRETDLARVAAEEQNGPGLWKFAGESGSDSTEIAN